MSDSLTAAERETVILLDDATDTMKITTFQRPILNRLLKNPHARLIEDVSQGSSVGAIFELPAWCLSIRAARRQGNREAFTRYNAAKREDGRP